MYYVYILKNEEGRYYIGSTSNIEKRLKKHNAGGSKWTSRYRPWNLTYSENFELKTNAIRREKQIKSYKGGNEFKKMINSVK